jgi:hypothetical protein
MPLETATYITSLVITNPDGSDQKNTADDHIRLLKACLKRTLPLLDGAVSLSHTQLMRLNDVSASVQLQLNTLRDGSATVYNALYANSASFAANSNNALSLGGAAAALYARRDQQITISAVWSFQGSNETIRLVGTNNYIAFYAANGSTRLGYIQVVGGSTLVINNDQGAVNLLGTNIFFNSSNQIWHSGNDGPGSGLNADLLHGLTPTIAAVGNTVVTRHTAGYIFATYFNQDSSETENPNIASMFVSSGDGYLRKATPAYVGSQIQTRNITGKAGTAKTISTTTPSGGVDGDIWYQI